MSSTQSLQRLCHMDRLPNELVAKILLHLDPPRIAIENDFYLENDPYLYEENPLFRVRLVSKRLYAVCQPILHRDLEIDATCETVNGVNKLRTKVQTSPERTSACRKLEVAKCWHDGRCVSLKRWSRLLPNVEHLEMNWSVGDAIFDHIAEFTKLRHLLVKLSGVKPPRTGVFPRLESLHLSSVTNLLDRPQFAAASFPNLRHLRVTTELPANDENAPNLFPLDLLAKLECLDVDGEAALEFGFKGWLDLDNLPRELPVLWRLRGGRTGSDLRALPSYLQRAAHLRLYHKGYGEPSYGAARDELRSLLGAHQDLRLVLVEKDFLSAASSPPDDDDDEPILVECGRRGVEVRSYRFAPDTEELVAPEFIAWVREQAARARSATRTTTATS